MLVMNAIKSSSFTVVQPGHLENNHYGRIDVAWNENLIYHLLTEFSLRKVIAGLFLSVESYLLLLITALQSVRFDSLVGDSLVTVSNCKQKESSSLALSLVNFYVSPTH